jgi:Uma2 family endonuclease
MTEQEFLRFCEVNDFVRIEREPNGEILVMSPANSKTSIINSRVCRLLDEWTEADGHGVAFDSSGGFSLPDGSMRSPDAAWVLRRRWDALTEVQQSGFAPVCPDFVIELRSPSDKLGDVQAKMKMWISNGTEVAWLIDPERRAVEIYRPRHSFERLHDPSSVQGTGPVAGFELVMSRVWQ